jgi:hypothetical protein
MKITKASLFQHFQNRHLQPDIVRLSWTMSGISPVSPQVQKSFLETFDWTIYGLARQCPTLSDNIRILNIGPTARFLRELYIYLHTSNGSPFVVLKFYY